MVKNDNGGKKNDASMPQDPPANSGGAPANPSTVSREEYDQLKSEFTKLTEVNSGIAKLVETIWADPELKGQVQRKFAPNVPDQQPPQTPPQDPNAGGANHPNQIVDRRLDDVSRAQRHDTIKRFEERYGIDKLPQEQATEVRKKIADNISKWGWDINSIPLANLDESLDSAYVTSHAEKLREEGKLEGIAQYRQNQMATMSQISGTAPNPSEHGNELTAAQKKWVDKLHVDEEKAKELYNDRENEETRVSKAEQKATGRS